MGKNNTCINPCHLCLIDQIRVRIGKHKKLSKLKNSIFFIIDYEPLTLECLGDDRLRKEESETIWWNSSGWLNGLGWKGKRVRYWIALWCWTIEWLIERERGKESNSRSYGFGTELLRTERRGRKKMRGKKIKNPFPSYLKVFSTCLRSTS